MIAAFGMLPWYMWYKDRWYKLDFMVFDTGFYLPVSEGAD